MERPREKSGQVLLRVIPVRYLFFLLLRHSSIYLCGITGSLMAKAKNCLRDPSHVPTSATERHSETGMPFLPNPVAKLSDSLLNEVKSVHKSYTVVNPWFHHLVTLRMQSTHRPMSKMVINSGLPHSERRMVGTGGGGCAASEKCLKAPRGSFLCLESWLV